MTCMILDELVNELQQREQKERLQEKARRKHLLRTYFQDGNEGLIRESLKEVGHAMILQSQEDCLSEHYYQEGECPDLEEKYRLSSVRGDWRNYNLKSERKLQLWYRLEKAPSESDIAELGEEISKMDGTFIHSPSELLGHDISIALRVLPKKFASLFIPVMKRKVEICGHYYSTSRRPEISANLEVSRDDYEVYRSYQTYRQAIDILSNFFFRLSSQHV